MQKSLPSACPFALSISSTLLQNANQIKTQTHRAPAALSYLSTVSTQLIPSLDPLRDRALALSPILLVKHPERVLLGSLWDSNRHRLILMPIIGRTISEQDGAYAPGKVAEGFTSEKKNLTLLKNKISLHGIINSLHKYVFLVGVLIILPFLPPFCLLQIPSSRV